MFRKESDDEEEIHQMGTNEIEKVMKEQEAIEKAIKKNGWNHFSRPPLDQVDQKKDFHFMQTDCDQYSTDKECVVRMFGLTEKGNSILINIYGFLAYFYIQKPKCLVCDTPQQLEEFTKAFNNKLKDNVKNIKEDAIKSIEVVYKESVRYYKGEDGKIEYLKILCFNPTNVATIRNWLKPGNRSIGGADIPPLTFESNMPYALRFMIDKNIVGMGWVKLIGGHYSINLDPKKMQSKCQLELHIDHQYVEALPTQQYPLIAPVRVLSFDIECAAQKGFPNPSQDPVIQIACIVKEHNTPHEIVRVVFTHLECANIPGAHVRSFDKEQDLLVEFQRFMQALDPDFITGYNIQNFDFPYIMQRAEKLGLKDYGMFPRVLSVRSKLKDGKFQSKAMGMRDTKEINIEGRIQIDMMMHMMREHKLSSYSLNNVSYVFLNEQKEDVHHSIIYTLQYGKDNMHTNGNPETRKRIAVYCLKDAYLPILLMDKLLCIYNYSEMARVTGVPINYLFMRGQQIKVASMLYRKTKTLDYIIPTENFERKIGDQYDGAFVLDPERNFYKNPIATLDFASLYPSIMMAHNLCYTTLVQESQKGKLDPQSCTKAPSTNATFVKPSVRKGLLPIILEELISARKQARLELAKATDPMLKAVLDGRQLALKVSANSVYGFTGAQIGQLPCLEISASVTGFGREMIMQTKDLVTSKYCKQNGYQTDAKVIYGDTDSVMVDFGVEDVKLAMQLGKEAAAHISTIFIAPIKLEFEKVYWPYLLMNRKRYAGLLWTKPEKYDKIDTKGIESVRRDNCPLIRRMITTILNYMLIERDDKKAVEYTKQIVSNLLQNKVDISDLVITKSLNKKTGDDDENKGKKDKFQDKENKDKNSKQDAKKITNTYKQRQAHVILAEKMQQRDETTAPAAGDRIPYIMIDGGKGTKNFENAEDPIEVLMKDLPIDFDYYINKQLKQPIIRIFEFSVPNAEAIFHGEHTMKRYIPKVSQNAALGKFVVRKKTCLNCKSGLNDDQPLCKGCQSKAMEVITQKTYELQDLQQQFHELWGSLLEEVICSNGDCPIYYKRKKISKDLQEKWAELDRFEGW